MVTRTRWWSSIPAKKGGAETDAAEGEAAAS
jgi:hypothetical protein